MLFSLEDYYTFETKQNFVVQEISTGKWILKSAQELLHEAT